MRRARGYTLIELAVVIAVIAVISGLVVVYVRATVHNAQLPGATGEITNRIFALRMAALADGLDRLLVVVDAPGSDASQCGMFNRSRCARLYVLSGAGATWALSSFDPDHPAGSGANAATILEWFTLGTGVHLDLTASAPALPAPFSAITANDSDLVGSSKCGSLNCFALRFNSAGQVAPVYASSSTAEKTGLAFVLGTDQNATERAAERKEVLVSFPAGIVRILTF